MIDQSMLVANSGGKVDKVLLSAVGIVEINQINHK